MSGHEKEETKTKKWIIFITFCFIIFNGLSFLNLEGSCLALPSSLFNMIIFLTIIIFLLNKKKLDFWRKKNDKIVNLKGLKCSVLILNIIFLFNIQKQWVCLFVVKIIN